MEVKKPMKYKPPVIKQTLTSLYRIAKTNPLLFIDNEPGCSDLNSAKLPRQLQHLFKKPTQVPKLTIPKPQLNRDINKTTCDRPSRSTLKLSKPAKLKVDVPKPSTSKKGLVAVTQPNAKPSEAKGNSNKVRKRRSLSADYFERMKSTNLHRLTNIQMNNNNYFVCLSPIVEHRVKFRSLKISKGPLVVYTSTPYI